MRPLASGQLDPSATPEKVYVVDDDPQVRRALTRLLRSHGFDAESFGFAEDLLTVAPTHEGPACLVVDLRMPGIGGLDLQDLLLQQGLEMGVVFVSGRASFESGIRAMKGGAVDFLEKPVSEQDLIAAVERALHEDRERRARQSVRSALRIRFAALTPREREVFDLIVTGLLNKQVAAALGTAEKTVKVHRARVMHKMEAGSIAQLVRMADALGAGPRRR